MIQPIPRQRFAGVTYPRARLGSVECGTITKYGEGCRCEPCRDAKKAETNRYRHGVNLQPIETLTNLPMTARPVDAGWRAEALCKELCDAGTHDPAWWINVEQKHLPKVLKICAMCPVLEPCKEWAVTLPEPVGVWGGTLPKERGSFR